MKTNNTDKFLMAMQENKILLKNCYSFQLKDRAVKVVFSDSANAQTIESALVKIATRRIG